MSARLDLGRVDAATRVLHPLPALVDVAIEPDQHLVVVGDTHGHVEITTAITTAFPPSEKCKLLFLGDYVDRGEQQVENILLVAGLLLGHPKDVIILRGNHEERVMNDQYGFIDALSMLDIDDEYPRFEALFHAMPVAAMLASPRVFMVHGMIPARRPPVFLDELRSLQKAASLGSWDEVTVNLLWSDPDPGEREESTPSSRGAGMLVGKHDLDAFLAANHVDLVLRSHQSVPGGYSFLFASNVLSIFSSPASNDYRGVATIAIVHGDGLVEVRGVDRAARTFPALAYFRLDAGRAER